MLYYFYDWTWLILLPAMALVFYAQYKVAKTFNKMGKVKSNANWSGKLVAEELLTDQHVFDVKVKRGAGRNMGDHYNPQTKIINLSEEIYDGTSVLSMGVAAHEAGHAIQHANGYFFMRMRTALVPLVNMTSNLSVWMILMGFFFTDRVGALFINLGIIFFLGGVIFQLVTLPVEINASRTAIALLDEKRMVTGTEREMVEEVLSAAALTYIASVAAALSNLVRILFLTRGRRGRDD